MSQAPSFASGDPRSDAIEAADWVGDGEHGVMALQSFEGVTWEGWVTVLGNDSLVIRVQDSGGSEMSEPRWRWRWGKMQKIFQHHFLVYELLFNYYFIEFSCSEYSRRQRVDMRP